MKQLVLRIHLFNILKDLVSDQIENLEKSSISMNQSRIQDYNQNMFFFAYLNKIKLCTTYLCEEEAERILTLLWLDQHD